MWRKVLLWGGMMVLLALLLAGVWLRAWPDVEMGRRLAENNCAICHDLSETRKHKKGPYLWGVVDRAAGSVDFAYSAAFLGVVQERPFVWDESHLQRFITDPALFVPMTRMAQRDSAHPLAFEGIESADNRRDLIAYLRRLK
ncbi:MAG: c-type cytochrome [Magnetococcales bacterium]|nr:c-type cytochrome [Magnetococcales bacterium]